MITVIAKKIMSGNANGNAAHTRGLTEYMGKPESESRTEKCIAFQDHGFGIAGQSLEDQAREMADACKLVDPYSERDLIAHWVISFKGGRPEPERILKAAEDFVADLGYGPGVMWNVAIHDDTDNRHAHIQVCRANVLTEKIVKEGWWKRESQKSLARIAHTYGWRQEKGARYRVVPNSRPEAVETTDPLTGETLVRYRPKAIKIRKDNRDREPEAMEPPAVREQAAREEARTGVKSRQRLLQEKLTRFYEEHKDNFSQMKWGQLHVALAGEGIEMELVEHGKRKGLTFTLDGEVWEKAGAVCPAMSYDALDGKLGAKKGTWRKARPEVREMAVKAREEIEFTEPVAKLAEVEMCVTILDAKVNRIEIIKELESNEDVHFEDAPAAETKTGIIDERFDLSKEQIAKLRAFPLEDAMAMFPGGHSTTRRVRNPIDYLVYQHDKTYDEACQLLAGKFFDRLDSKTVDDWIREAKEAGARIESPAAERIARDIIAQWDALQLDRMDLHTSIPQSMRKEKFYNFIKNDAKLIDVLKAIPNLQRLSMHGTIETDPVHIFFSPKWPEGKVGIMLDDVRPDFLSDCPPSAVIATSDRSRQAFYILSKKYEPEFYDYFIREINVLYGDKKILKVGHDSRLAGFANQKREKTGSPGKAPVAKVVNSSSRYPVEMEKIAENFYRRWKQQRETIQPAQPRRNISVGDSKEKATGEKAGTRVWENIRKVELDENFIRAGLREQERIRKIYGKDVKTYDRSRCDSMTARFLYDMGATPDQVASWLYEYQEQDETPVPRERTDGSLHDAVRIHNDKERWRKARLTAYNLAPVGVYADNWRERNEKEGKIMGEAVRLAADRDREAVKNAMKPSTTKKPRSTKPGKPEKPEEKETTYISPRQ